MRATALTLTFLLACSLIADSIEKRTADLVAMFNKTKQVSKNKRGVTKSIFLDIQSKPVVRKDLSTYSGTYVERGFGFSVTLQVREDGTVAGNGLDDRGKYTLRDARMRGAMLTGTKVYAISTTAPLDAVFLQRTTREGTAPDRITGTHTSFGLGVHTPGFETDGTTLEKLFYEPR